MSPTQSGKELKTRRISMKTIGTGNENTLSKIHHFKTGLRSCRITYKTINSNNRNNNKPTMQQFIGLTALFLFALIGATSANIDKIMSESEGKTVMLHCPINKEKCGDLHSVNWYKGETRIAAMLLEHSNVTSVMGEYQDRVTVEQNPFGLRITDLRISDEDVYLCDTTFFIPIETCDIFNGYRIELKVLVPPTEVVIQDEKGERIQNGSIVGPMEERTQLKASCVVHNTRPQPQVGWWRGDNRLTTHSPSYDEKGGLYTATLELQLYLSRIDLAQNIECRVDSAAIPTTIRKYFSVDVHVRPTNITIDAEKHDPKQGERAKLTCGVYGARPPANIAWYNGSIIISPEENDLTQIRATALEQVDGTYYTHSELSFNATRFENDRTFRCEAANSVLESNHERPLSKAMVLEVTYPPVVYINPLNITVNAGVQVLINCQYIANPASLRHVAWYRNGELVNVNDSSRYLGGNPENVALSILSAQKEDNGNYTCELSNANGIGVSQQQAELDVQFVPEVEVLMIPEGPVKESDEANVTLYCNIQEANPPLLTKVRWYANGTLLKELPDCQETREDLCHIDPSKLLLESIGRGFFYNYSCKGYNEAGWGGRSDEKELRVHYEPGPASVTYYPLIPIKNKSVTLKCEVKDPGFPEATSFQWLSRGRRPQQDVSQMESLIIEKLGLLDRTNYSCYAFNEGGKGQMGTATLEVYAPPLFIKNLPPYTGVLHTTRNASLTCRIECVPRCEISWLRDSVPIDKNDTRYFIRDKYMAASPATGDFESMLSVLHFNMSNWPNNKFDIERDNANYSCVSTGNKVGDGINSRTWFSIEYAPENVNVSDKVVYVEEDTIPTQRVICSSKAYPVPTYEWRFNNRTIVHDNTLILNGPIKRNETGVYTCFVANKHGNSKRETYIDVQYKPRCEIERREIDDSDTLICSAYGNPSDADFTWSIKAENETIEWLGGGDARTNKDKSFFILEEDYAIARTYRCVANNTIGLGSYCEIEVAEQLAWWQRWDKTTLIILVASILVLLLAVIIICCIIICICRRRRRQDKYRTDVSISATQSVLSYQSTMQQASAPQVGVAMPVPVKESMPELLPDTLKKNANISLNNNNNNKSNNNNINSSMTSTNTLSTIGHANARTPTLTVRHTPGTVAHAPKSPPRWPLRPGVMVHVSNDTKENLAINRMTLKPSATAQLLAQLSLPPKAATSTSTIAPTNNSSMHEQSLLSTSSFLNASTTFLLNHNINGDGGSSHNTSQLTMGDGSSSTVAQTSTLGRHSKRHVLNETNACQTLPSRSSKSTTLATLKVNPNNQILTVNDGGVQQQQECATDAENALLSSATERSIDQEEAPLDATISNDDILEVEGTTKRKTTTQASLQQCVGNFFMRIFRRGSTQSSSDTTRDSQRSHVGLLGGVLNGARNVLRQRPQCLDDDHSDGKSPFDVEHRLKGIRCSGSVTYKKNVGTSTSATTTSITPILTTTRIPNASIATTASKTTASAATLIVSSKTPPPTTTTTTTEMKSTVVLRNNTETTDINQVVSPQIQIQTAPPISTRTTTTIPPYTPDITTIAQLARSHASVTFQTNSLDNNNISNATSNTSKIQTPKKQTTDRPTSLTIKQLQTAQPIPQRKEEQQIQPMQTLQPPPPLISPTAVSIASTAIASSKRNTISLTRTRVRTTSIPPVKISRSNSNIESSPPRGILKSPTPPPRPPPPFHGAPPPLERKRSNSSCGNNIPTIDRSTKGPKHKNQTQTTATVVATPSTTSKIEHVQIHDKSSSLADPLTEPGEYENLPFHGLQTAPNKQSSSSPTNFNNNTNVVRVAPRPKRLNGNIMQTQQQHQQQYYDQQLQIHHHQEQEQQQQQQQQQQQIQHHHQHSTMQYGRNHHIIQHHQPGPLSTQQTQALMIQQHHHTPSQQQLTKQLTILSSHSNKNIQNIREGGVGANYNSNSGNVGGIGTAADMPPHQIAYNLNNCFPRSYTEYYHQQQQQKLHTNSASNAQLLNAIEHDFPAYAVVERNGNGNRNGSGIGRESKGKTFAQSNATTNPFLVVSNFKKFDTSSDGIESITHCGNKGRVGFAASALAHIPGLTNSMHRNKRKPFIEKSEDKKFYSLKFTGGKNKNHGGGKSVPPLNIGGGTVILGGNNNNNKCKRHHSFAGGSRGDIDSPGTLVHQLSNGSLLTNDEGHGEASMANIKSHAMRFYDPPVYENLNDSSSVQIHECEIESSAGMASSGTATILLHPQPSTSAPSSSSSSSLMHGHPHAPSHVNALTLAAGATGQKKKHRHRQHQQKDDFNLIEPERLSIYRSDSGISNSSYECATSSATVGNILPTSARHAIGFNAKSTHKLGAGLSGLMGVNFLSSSQKKSTRLTAINGAANTNTMPHVYINVDGQSAQHLERSSSPASSALINSSYESASSSQNDGNVGGGCTTDPTSISSCNSIYSSGTGTLVSSGAFKTSIAGTSISNPRCNRHQKPVEITTPDEYEQYQLGHHTRSTSSLSVASSISGGNGATNANGRIPKSCKRRSPLSANELTQNTLATNPFLAATSTSTTSVSTPTESRTSVNISNCICPHTNIANYAKKNQQLRRKTISDPYAHIRNFTDSAAWKFINGGCNNETNKHNNQSTNNTFKGTAATAAAKNQQQIQQLQQQNHADRQCHDSCYQQQMLMASNFQTNDNDNDNTYNILTNNDNDNDSNSHNIEEKIFRTNLSMNLSKSAHRVKSPQQHQQQPEVSFVMRPMKLPLRKCHSFHFQSSQTVAGMRSHKLQRLRTELQQLQEEFYAPTPIPEFASSLSPSPYPSIAASRVPPLVPISPVTPFARYESQGPLVFCPLTLNENRAFKPISPETSTTQYRINDIMAKTAKLDASEEIKQASKSLSHLNPAASLEALEELTRNHPDFVVYASKAGSRQNLMLSDGSGCLVSRNDVAVSPNSIDVDEDLGYSFYEDDDVEISELGIGNEINNADDDAEENDNEEIDEDDDASSLNKTLTPNDLTESENTPDDESPNATVMLTANKHDGGHVKYLLTQSYREVHI